MQLRTILMVVAMAGCGGSSAPKGVGNTSTEKSPPVLTAPRTNPQVTQWIAKLGNAQTADSAIAQLETLGDPSAIEPLGEHWKDSKTVYALVVMIGLARPLTPDEARAKYIVDFEKTGRPASWDRLLPYLRTAIATIDVENPRSVDGAMKAAQAIEEARLAGAQAELTELVSQPPNKKWLSAQIASIRALGAIGGADARRSLLGVIMREPPPHPRTQKTRELQRLAEEHYSLHLALTGASINAVGTLSTVDEVDVLIKQMFVTPELFMQLRRALVANGLLAAEPLRKVLRAEHAGVNELIREHKLDRYCGTAGDLPPTQCQQLSVRDFYAAAVLGDLHDDTAVPDLVDALKRPAAPYYYADDLPSPTTQHAAIVDALRKIGSAAPVAQLRSVWTNRRLDVVDRTLALDAYGVLAPAGTDVHEIGKIAADNVADDTLRQAAATAYARLARESIDIGLMFDLASRYVDASAKKRAAADKEKPNKDKADATFGKAEQTMVAAKAALVKTANDSATSAQQIIDATTAMKKAEGVYKEAKKKHKAQIAPWKAAEQAATAYTGYARMFQSKVASIEIAMTCKDDVSCYVATVTQPHGAISGRLQARLDVSSWSAAERQGLYEEAVDRSMLELGKRGTAASAMTEPLLDHLMTNEPTPSRAVVQAILLVLPKIAPRPCPSCVTKLDPAKVELKYQGELAAEAKLVHSYFTWAK